jgi:excisionase family DNA binding protein
MSSTRDVVIDQTEKLLLKAEEVARRLSLGRATVYLMIASGELPTFRRGRAVRVPTHALEEWIKSQDQCREGMKVRCEADHQQRGLPAQNASRGRMTSPLVAMLLSKRRRPLAEALRQR